MFDRICFPALLFFLLNSCSSDDSKTPIAVQQPTQKTAEKNGEHEGHQFEEPKSSGSLLSDFENPNRAIWQKPELVISQLGDLTGKTVADIGAGTGYFAFRMASKAKKVVAIEIDPRMINFMDSVKVRLPADLQPRFESRLSKPNDPLLRPGEANAVTIVNTIGYIENRVDYLKKLRVGMAPGGLLLIIDFKKNLPVGPEEKFKIGLAELEAELRQAGFEPVHDDNKSLDYQYILLAKKV